MIKIPYEEIVAKIKEKSGLSDEDINSKISEKTKQLSGLISKEGAAHIIANELGIKLFEDLTGKLQIKNILAGMRDVETVGRVQQIFDVREFETNGRKGKVASLVVGDETGSIRFVLWGDQTNNISNVKEGDIVKVMGGYVRDNQGRKEIHLNDKSQFIINPEGEEVKDVKVTQEVNSTRKSIKDLNEGDSGVELLGTIVEVFEPRFFEVCPSCSKRARINSETNKFNCGEHGEVNPDYSYVFNVVLDDGSENIRAVFFREQMESLLQLKKEEIMKYKDEPEKFFEAKNGLLGSIIKVEGRVNKNEMFDRIEFLTRNVDPKPNPEAELQRLQPEK